MKPIKFISSLVLAATAFAAQAEVPNKWYTTAKVVGGDTSTIHYVIDQQGNALTIICGLKNPAMMIATINGQNYGPGQPGGDFVMRVGKETLYPSDAGSNAGGDNFRQAWKAIAMGKQVAMLPGNGSNGVYVPTAEAIKVLFPDVTKTKCITY